MLLIVHVSRWRSLSRLLCANQKHFKNSENWTQILYHVNHFHLVHCKIVGHSVLRVVLDWMYFMARSPLQCLIVFVLAGYWPALFHWRTLGETRLFFCSRKNVSVSSWACIIKDISKVLLWSPNQYLSYHCMFFIRSFLVCTVVNYFCKYIFNDHFVFAFIVARIDTSLQYCRLHYISVSYHHLRR